MTEKKLLQQQDYIKELHTNLQNSTIRINNMVKEGPEYIEALRVNLELSEEYYKAISSSNSMYTSNDVKFTPEMRTLVETTIKNLNSSNRSPKAPKAEIDQLNNKLAELGFERIKFLKLLP